MTNSKSTYVILLVCVGAWCALAMLPPILALMDAERESAAPVVAMFSHVCHQLDSHSLHASGERFAVCARCFAIYAGFFAGTLIVPAVARRRTRRYVPAWLLAAGPMALDVLLDATPWYAATTASRLVSGGAFGLAAGILLIPLLLDAVSELLTPTASQQGPTHEPTTR